MNDKIDKMTNDHELITFELTKLDKYVVYWVVVSTIIMFISLDWLTTFEGVWIWGMPKSAFGIVLAGGLANLALTAVLYPAYKRHFEKLVNQR